MHTARKTVTTFLSVTNRSPASAGDNTLTVHSGTEYHKAHHRKDPLTDELTNPGLCIMIFRVSIVMAQVILQVIVVGDKYNNLICRAIIVIDLSSYYNQPQNKQTRGNVYQGYRKSTFQIRDPPNTHSDRCRQNYTNTSHLN